MIEQTHQVWVCNVKFRAYQNPTHELEYHCYSKAGGSLFMKRDHRTAGCGLYERIATEVVTDAG